MPYFKLVVVVEREIECFVDAESKEDLEQFMEANPEWKPGDVDGLIDRVSDETEVGYRIVPEERFTANFELAGGALREKDS